MPQVMYAEQGDEIVELIERVRKSADSHVALVLSAGAVGMQTPLNVRLLRQLGARAGKTVSIISGDPYIQELSRVGGLPTYASVPAFERGIQTVRAHSDLAFAGAAAAGATVAPPLGPPAPPRTATTPPGARGVGGRRRPWYFVAAGLVIVGLLLLALVAPSARVTITLTGTPITANPTIQGSPDPANAGQADHIVTAVVSSDQSAQFSATPTGTQQLPATAATATLVFQTDLPPGAQFPISKGDEFDTQGGSPIRFIATQNSLICIGANGTQPQNCPPGTPPNNSVLVVDGTPEARGNVAANTITKWPGNLCPKPPSFGFPGCVASDLTETNPTAATGGADAKANVVVSQGDVNNWTNQVTQSQQTLTTQVKSDMQTKGAGKTFAIDPGGNGTTVACDVTPPLPAANAVFAATQETVACHGKAAVYNPADITTDVNADLQQQVAQGDTLATSSITCSKPTVTQAADDGTVVLSIQCSSFSRPTVDLDALRGKITGRSSSDARNIVEHSVNHVQNVSISQSPVPFFWLPLFASRIAIDETFVTKASAGP